MRFISRKKKIFPVIAATLGLYVVGMSSPVLASATLELATKQQHTHVQLEQILTQQALVLTPQAFVHLALLRNPDVLLTTEQRNIAQQQLNHDLGAYEAEFFANIVHDQRYSRINPESGLDDKMTDRNSRVQLGVRKLIRSGAELSFDYEGMDRFNDTLSSTDPSGIDDSTGGLNLRVRQPLLRGIGATQVESRIEQARLQLTIAKQEIEQQVLTKTFEALSHYWQLYREEQLFNLTHDSYSYAQLIVEDTQRLVEAGRLPETALIEARSSLLLRESQLSAAKHGYNRALNAIRTFLNLSALDGQDFRFITQLALSEAKWPLPEDFDSYFNEVLHTWPNYQIVQHRIQIEQKNLTMAQDELRPKLDLVMAYGQTSRRFDKQYDRTFENAFSDRYPHWSVGIEFSMPISGNQRARAKQSIANSRIQQSQIQSEAARVDLANQLHIRFDQVDNAFEELRMHVQNTTMLQMLLEVERSRFETGTARLMNVIEREDNLNMGVVRQVNAQISYELAKVALQLYDGSLLKSMEVDFDVDLLDQNWVNLSKMMRDTAQSSTKSSVVSYRLQTPIQSQQDDIQQTIDQTMDSVLVNEAVVDSVESPVIQVEEESAAVVYDDEPTSQQDYRFSEAKSCKFSQAECLAGKGYWLQLAIVFQGQQSAIESYLDKAEVDYVSFEFEYQGRPALTYSTGPFSGSSDPLLGQVQQRLKELTPIQDAYLIFHGIN